MTIPPYTSFAYGGWWLTEDPWLWNAVDDYGTCVPINPFHAGSLDQQQPPNLSP